MVTFRAKKIFIICERARKYVHYFFPNRNHITAVLTRYIEELVKALENGDKDTCMRVARACANWDI